MWVGAGGLNLYNPVTDNFKQFKPDNSCNHKTVNTEYVVNIFDDGQGKLWLGTWAGGINIFDTKSGSFSYMMVDKEIYGPLKTNDIGSVYKDSKGFLWFASTGFTKFNPLNQKFEWISTADGLPHNASADILEDNFGKIWMSTINGLALLDPVSKEIRVFDKSDGLQGNEFTFNAAIKSSDGRLYFGGSNGFSIVDPDKIPIDKHIPNVLITDFQIFNRSIKIGEKRSGRVILEKNISSIYKITLSHHESVFSFEFTALHYAIPEKNKYAYMLEGLETEWNYANSERRYATYTTLKPGKYVFRVKASNSDGVWNEEGCSVEITILPPWWKTIWFISFLFILLFCFISLFYYMQLRSVIIRNRKLDYLVKLKTSDLEKVNSELNDQRNSLLSLNESLEKYQQEIVIQKEEITLQNRVLQAKNLEILDMSQKIHDQDQMKLRYFTNISHEFRTPLTLILSPLDKIIKSGAINRQLAGQVALIEVNAKRLLRLVNQLLDISKIESGTLSIKKISGNFIELIQTIYSVFKEQAAISNLKFQLDLTVNELFIFFDFDKVEKIIYNLLSNSFKFTADGGSINMIVGIENDHVFIIISDTGIGISPNNFTKIFDPFYQIDSSTTRFHEGSGIGLYHSRELAEAIGGSINIESELGKGTTVKLIFPLEPFDIESGITKSQDNDPEKEHELDDGTNGFAYNKNKRNIALKASILIVEDNLQLRNYLKSELSESYTIYEASNGREGYEMALKYYPELVISDIMMPEMDGLDLCRAIKEDQLISHIPVILLTAKVDENDAIEGIATGADDYIPKPFNIEYLAAKIEQLLTSRKKLREKFSKEVFLEPSNIGFSNTDKVFLQKLIKIIEDNITNEDFLVNDIAREIGIGKTNLYKKITALTDQSVADFVRKIKLKKAAHLLLTNEYSVSEVSYMVGYKDASHFIKSFSRQYGLTPKKFIEQNSDHREM
jgi:signal transduction histidine kinase/DNA-binding response OmpR family regulator